MDKSVRKILYRFFCAVSLIIGIYIVIDLCISGTLDLRMIIVFIFLLVAILWATADWRLTNALLERQEKELKMYQLYIQPLEELVKEIRARQHEFDNHMNAILNMHLTVDSYDQLVEQQSRYIHEVRMDSSSKYLPLLRISDKVLAGFLYSKIVSTPEYVQTDVEIRNWQIISGISEHQLIEVAGVLVDNAYEACIREGKQCKVKILLNSENDRVIFEVFNQYPKLSFEEIGQFFEVGYTTKTAEFGKHGIGLGRVKAIVEKAGGEITVGQEETEGENYIHFTVVI